MDNNHRKYLERRNLENEEKAKSATTLDKRLNGTRAMHHSLLSSRAHIIFCFRNDYMLYYGRTSTPNNKED